MSDSKFYPAPTYWLCVKTPNALKPIGELMRIDKVAQLLEVNAEALAVRVVLAMSFEIQGFVFHRVHEAQPPVGVWPQGTGPESTGDQWKDADE